MRLEIKSDGRRSRSTEDGEEAVEGSGVEGDGGAWRRGHGLRGMRGVSLLAAALLWSGCFPKTHIPFRPAASLSAVRPNLPVAAAFQPSLESRLQLELVAVKKAPPGYEAFSFSAPSLGFNRQPENRVTGTFYRSQSSGRKPLVVALPVWGTSVYPTRVTTRELLRGPISGRVHVLRLDGSASLFDWYSMAQAASQAQFFAEVERGVKTFETVVKDLRRLVDWAAARPEVDGRRIGVVGFSMSAVVGTVAMGLEPGISSGAFVMGGGDLHEIFAACGGKPSFVRRMILRRFEWDAQRFFRGVGGTAAIRQPDPLRGHDRS